MDVLVAVDMGQGSDTVLQFGADLAGQTDGTLHVVHIITDEERESRQQTPGQSQYVDVMLDETTRDLASSLVSLGISPTSTTAIARTGKPSDQIHKVAEEQAADVVVIGMRRRSRVGKFLLGSDLQDLLLSSRLPVMAVPMDELG